MKQHSERKHAKYGASSAYRWMKCAGSTKLVAVAPEQESSPDAKEGTAAHEILDHCLTNRIWQADTGWIDMGCPVEHLRGEIKGHLDAIQTALDYVKDILDTYEDAELYVEQAFQFPSLVDPENTWGTCDIAIYIPSLNLLYVIDYKHGAGTVVEVDDNPQLLYYATGFVANYNVLDIPLVDDSTMINLTVIQPRCVHARGVSREWPTNKARLDRFVTEVDNAILAAMADDAPLCPGDKQCKWCPAKLTCPAIEAQAAQLVKTNFRTVKEVIREGLPDVSQLPIDRVVTILQAQSLIEDYFKEVRTLAYNHLMAGGFVPGFKIVEARASRKWYDKDGKDQNIAEALMRLIGTDDWDVVYPRQLITITEAEAKVKEAYKARAPRGKKKQAAGDATQAMAVLTLKESSGNLTLVEASDPRPEYRRAAVNFANVQAPALPSPAQNAA